MILSRTLLLFLLYNSNQMLAIGVFFAIAFAILLLFNIKFDKVRYDHNSMRPYLIKIFESNVIEHFPQDLNCGIPQEVLPLAKIRAKDAIHIPQCEIKQSKLSLSLLQKNCNFHKFNEEINNNFFKNAKHIKRKHTINNK